MVKYFRGDTVESWFETKLGQLHLTASAELMERLDRYYCFLSQKNAVMNLTAITERSEIYKKHFFDSLCLSLAVDPAGKTLLDVGSGAGFPSLPLKLAFPDLDVTIVDSLGKRIRFLEELKGILGLPDVKLVLGRAEELPMKNHFDIVTARAVARLDILTELCLPFVKAGGVFIAMKAKGCEEELQSAQNAIRVLGGNVEREISYEIDESTERVLIVIRKLRTADPRYPRTFAQIKKNPL
jgi:16S rRNA (guanine527-N7)-methyltransferase